MLNLLPPSSSTTPFANSLGYGDSIQSFPMIGDEVLSMHVGMLLTWPWEHDYMTYGVFSDVANAC
jgi:hypothetical protein